MANITPRRDKNGNITSYTIRVYHGYDSSGKRLKPFTTSYKPEKGATAKQAEKAAQKFADEFENECLHFGDDEPNDTDKAILKVPGAQRAETPKIPQPTPHFGDFVALCRSEHQASSRAARSRRY